MDDSTIKPFHLIVLAVFAVAAIIGLFVFANFSGGNKSAAVGVVEVWGTLPKGAIEDTIAELAAVDDRYTGISYVEIPEDSFARELADALASGSGPDLILMSHERLVAERPKLVAIPYSTLSERTFKDTYLPLFELFLTDEGVYGVPLALDPLVLYYNRAILASEQMVSAPTTWEAVGGLASAASEKTGAGVLTQSAVALGSYENIQNARAILSLLLLQSGTPITSASSGTLRSVLTDTSSAAEGLSPAESALNYYVQFADPAKSVYSWNRSQIGSRDAFVQGDLALYLGFASERTFLEEANPNLDFDMARVPSPGTATTRVGYGVGYVFAIPKGATNKEGALSVAFALSDPPYGQQIAEKLMMAPALRQSLAARQQDPYRAVYYPEALVAKGWLSPAPEETDRVFSTMIGDMTSGRADADKALSAASRALEEAMR